MADELSFRAEYDRALSHVAGHFLPFLLRAARLFPDPARALAEFCRVARSGARAAVSVWTAAERAYSGRINVIMARTHQSWRSP
jgi:hypothetical protein